MEVYKATGETDRTVSLYTMAEAHSGASQTIHALREEYKQFANVKISAVDNTNTPTSISIDKVQQRAYDVVERSLQHELARYSDLPNHVSESIKRSPHGTIIRGGLGSRGTGTNNYGSGTRKQISIPGKSAGGSASNTRRGSFSPSSNTISLLKNADLPTFLYELGHSFLALDIALAEQIALRGATEAETQILDDMQTVFNWFDLQGDLSQQLDAWHALSFEQQRTHHEKLAEGFEAYLFEGQAPNLALQPIFQRFRAWLSNVYALYQPPV